MKSLISILFISFFISALYQSKLLSQQITWSRIYGDTGSVSEQGVDILQSYDGNYIVLAARSYDNNNQKILLLKLDMYGNVMWEKMVADSILSHNPYRFQQTRDSGFIITGVSGSAFLIKTDKNGNLEWRKIYTQTYPQTYSSFVITTPDNGFVFCGRVPFFTPPSDKGYVVKTDSVGNVEWERVYVDSLFTNYNEIIQTNEVNGYYLVGRTYNITQPVTNYTITKKLNLAGDIIWSNTFGRNSTGLNIMILDDTSLIVSSSKQTPFSPRLFRIDIEGNLIWDNSFISPSFSGSVPNICKDNQNNIQKVGGINSNITYTEISPTGQQLVIFQYNTSGFYATYANVIKNANDGGFIIVGTSSLGPEINQKHDVLIYKTDSNGIAPLLVKVISNSEINNSEYQLFQNFPNPFNPRTKIKFNVMRSSFVEIEVYDIGGKIIEKSINEYLRSGNYEVEFDGMNLSSGIYFYNMKIDGKIFFSKRMILLK